MGRRFAFLRTQTGSSFLLGYPQFDVEIGCRTLPNPWSTLTSVVSSAAEDEILFVTRGPVCLAVIWGLLSSVGIIEVKLRNEFLEHRDAGSFRTLKWMCMA